MNPAARWLHPGAWWLWALGLGVAATRTTNPVLIGLIIAVCTLVVSNRRPYAEWAGSFSVFVRMGLVVVAIRVVFALLFGVRFGTATLLTLPTVGLPDWMAGVSLGGALTAEMLVFALIQGAQLATLLICIGAANSLASPARLLKSLPGGLYHVGVAAVVALALAPRLVVNVRRISQLRRLRGRATRGLRPAAESALPVFEASLDDAIALAAAMDTRGYGRTTTVSTRSAALQGSLILAGLVGMAVGLYGVLDAAGAGWVLMAAGLVLAVTGLVLAGRRVTRTRYRPDPWGPPEWLTALSGIVAAVGVAAAGTNYLTVPLGWPDLPLLATACVLVAALPAALTPPPPLPWGYR